MKKIYLAIKDLDFTTFNEILDSICSHELGKQMHRINRKILLYFFFKSQSCHLISDLAFSKILSIDSPNIVNMVIKKASSEKLLCWLKKLNLIDFLYLCTTFNKAARIRLQSAWNFAYLLYQRFHNRFFVLSFASFLSVPDYWCVTDLIRCVRSYYKNIDIVLLHDQSKKLIGSVLLSSLIVTRGRTKLLDVVKPIKSINLRFRAQITKKLLLTNNIDYLPVVDFHSRVLAVIDLQSYLDNALAKILYENEKYLEISNNLNIFIGEKQSNVLMGALACVSGLLFSFFAGGFIMLMSRFFTLNIKVMLVYPVMSSICGNFGTQIILGTIQHRSKIYHEILKGLFVGLTYTVLLCVAVALASVKYEYRVFIVIALCMFCNVCVAVILGFLIPRILRTAGSKSYIAAAPILASCLDVFGFIVAGTLSTILLS